MTSSKATPIGILATIALTTLMLAAPSASAQVASDFSPGSEIKNRTASKNCTASWTGSINGEKGFLTAGHCGSIGDVFTDSNGAALGTMTRDMDSDLFDDEGNQDFSKFLGDATPDIGFVTMEKGVKYSGIPEGLTSTTTIEDTLSSDELKSAGDVIVGKSGKNSGQTHRPYARSVSDDYFYIKDFDGFAVSGDSGSPLYIYSKDKSSVYPVGTLAGTANVTMNYAQDVWGFKAKTTS